MAEPTSDNHTPLTDEILAIIDQQPTNRYEVALRLTRWAEQEFRRREVEARKRAAGDIMNLANEYANQDKTMHGSENIRGYHYFNAINKIGDFDGR